MLIAVGDVDFSMLNMRARLPFRYGIAELTVLPHLFVQLRLEVDGCSSLGIAAEGLPPKWFTKDPDTSFEQDLADMLLVIRQAAVHAQTAGSAESVFDLWLALYQRQEVWGKKMGFPPLLWGLGVSVVERAVIDALCRQQRQAFAQMLRSQGFGIRLGAIHPDLASFHPADLLARRPLQVVTVRHTVGLSDPLTKGDLDGSLPDDGLPGTLEEAVRTYGLQHFKIKLSGDHLRDRERLRALAILLPQWSEHCRFSLDGNEQYPSWEAFRSFWEQCQGDPHIASFLQRLLFVEQPLARTEALTSTTAAALHAWQQAPPIILDESDAELHSATQALALGYAGVSHKNCKGVIRGIANACLIAWHRQQHPDRRFVLTGEDLANVGPIALLQDLAVMASLGIRSIERNGHHYFRGLAVLPEDFQERMLLEHPDLYIRHERGFATLHIQDGLLRLDSVCDAPFGCAPLFPVERFTPLAAWRYASLATAMS